jgi:small GTP-binding protein
VGKTALLARYASDHFSTSHTVTLGIDTITKLVQIEEVPVKLVIHDTAGQELYYSLIRSFYKKINGVLFVYSIACRHSFERLDYWVREVAESNSNYHEVVKVLVGAQGDR